MGFRFRKSLNLGGGFRINLSKSGVGYSFGGKGFRYTKKSTGGTRKTYSIPGTGISYVSDSKKNVNNVTPPHTPSSHSRYEENYYDSQLIENGNAENMVSSGLEEVLEKARQTLKTNKICSWTIALSLIIGCINPIFWLISAGAIIWKWYIKHNGFVELNYEIDEELQEHVDGILTPLINITKSERVWRIMESRSVIDTKYSGGAQGEVRREICIGATKMLFPFKTNSAVAAFITTKEKLYFLPDALFIVQGNKIGAVKYDDLTFETSGTRFVEDLTIPKDAKVVGSTWKYVNKSGGPDRRFSDNVEYPICVYGCIDIKSQNGLNTKLMFSNLEHFNVKYDQ